MTTLPGTTTYDQLERDRYGRPLIQPPNGGKPKAYTRVSTLAKTLDDEYNLRQWSARMTAIGLNKRPDLAALVAASVDDKRALNKACQDAQEAAGSKTAANIGTAIHAFCEAVDNGAALDTVPADYRPHVEAYKAVTTAAGLLPMRCEQFVVNDDLSAAGTLDRLYWNQGFQSDPNTNAVVVGDIKTGNSDPKFIALATAIQIATYAHAATVNLDTWERTPLPVNHAVGYLVHVPQANPGKAAVFELDLEEGWNAALLAFDVRRLRGLRVHRLVHP